MNNEIESHEYNNSRISFMVGNEGPYYVNATEMAKPFGDKKCPGNWLRLKEVLTLISAVVHKMHVPESQLVVIKRGFGEKQGTWLHEVLAKEYARWLSIDLLIWTSLKLKEILKARLVVAYKVKYRSLVLEYLDFIYANLVEEIKEINQMEKENNQIPIALENRDLELSELEEKVNYYDNVLWPKNCFTTSVIAEELGMSSIGLSKLLNKLGVIYKIGTTWVLYSKHLKKGYTKTRTHVVKSTTTEAIAQIETIWTEKGREFILKTISDYNQQKNN